MPWLCNGGIMLITSIEANKNISTMARIYLEDNTSFCLPKKRISLLNLEAGGNIPDESLKYILNYEVYDAAKSAAVKFLTLKLRTSYEIKQKLNGLGYEEETINKVIDNLILIDYVNDYKYTIKYISEKIKLQPKSIKMISMELSFKGIPDDIICDAFQEISFNEDDIAYELIKKRFSKYTSFDEKLINKMRSFLISRGFSYGQISKAISKFLPED
jgi:regulatory protein